MAVGRLFLAAAGLGGGGYLCAIAVAVAPTYKLSIRTSPECTDEYWSSKAVALANPRRHGAQAEAVSTTIRVPPESPLAGLTDAQIMAAFVKGFFYGAVIAPERFLVSKVYGRDITHFEVDGGPSPEATPRFPSPASLPADALPPVHSKLWGAFQVLDKGTERPSASGSGACLDFGFGFNSPGSTFAGVDRVTVLRRQASKTDGTPARGQTLTVSYIAHACNPSVDKPLPSLLFSFHSFYARLLFRDGMAHVLAHL